MPPASFNPQAHRRTPVPPQFEQVARIERSDIRGGVGGGPGCRGGLSSGARFLATRCSSGLRSLAGQTVVILNRVPQEGAPVPDANAMNRCMYSVAFVGNHNPCWIDCLKALPIFCVRFSGTFPHRPPAIRGGRYLVNAGRQCSKQYADFGLSALISRIVCEGFELHREDSSSSITSRMLIFLRKSGPDASVRTSAPGMDIVNRFLRLA